MKRKLWYLATVLFRIRLVRVSMTTTMDRLIKLTICSLVISDISDNYAPEKEIKLQLNCNVILNQKDAPPLPLLVSFSNIPLSILTDKELYTVSLSSSWLIVMTLQI